MTFAEVHVKRSVILTDRLGPDILLVLTMKRQVLHRTLCNKLYIKLSFRGNQRQFSENIRSKDCLRSRIFGTFVVEFLACLPVLGFSKF